MMYVIDDLWFSVVTYTFAFSKDYSWGNEITMEEIVKKWVFRVGSEKHEADNRVIVNPIREANGEIRREEIMGREDTWKALRGSGLVMPTRK